MKIKVISLFLLCLFFSCNEKAKETYNPVKMQSKVKEYVQLGEKKEAEAYLDKCIKNYPKEYVPYMMRGMVLIEENESERGKHDFKKTIELLDSIIGNGGTDHTFFFSRAIVKVFLKDTTAYGELLDNRKFFENIEKNDIGRKIVENFLGFIKTNNEKALIDGVLYSNTQAQEIK